MAEADGNRKMAFKLIF